MEIFDALPDLLELAREQKPGNLYPFQDELRERLRADGVAFRWSMPLRLYRVCSKCGQQTGQVLYELEDPRQNTKISASLIHIHDVREHNAEMSAELKRFLANLKLTSP